MLLVTSSRLHCLPTPNEPTKRDEHRISSAQSAAATCSTSEGGIRDVTQEASQQLCLLYSAALRRLLKAEVLTHTILKND